MSVNKAILIGRLGQDPKTKLLDSGKNVCTFSLATDSEWKDKGGEKQKYTEWHRIVAWSPKAEVCAKYLTKGREVYIEGELRTRSYDKNGSKHYTTEIVVQNMTFIGNRQEDGGGHRSDGTPPIDEDNVPF